MNKCFQLKQLSQITHTMITGQLCTFFKGKTLSIKIDKPQHDKLVELLTASAKARNACLVRTLLPLNKKRGKFWVSIKLPSYDRLQHYRECLGHTVVISYRLVDDKIVLINLDRKIINLG